MVGLRLGHFKMLARNIAKVVGSIEESKGLSSLRFAESVNNEFLSNNIINFMFYTTKTRSGNAKDLSSIKVTQTLTGKESKDTMLYYFYIVASLITQLDEDIQKTIFDCIKMFYRLYDMIVHERHWSTDTFNRYFMLIGSWKVSYNKMVAFYTRETKIRLTFPNMDNLTSYVFYIPFLGLPYQFSSEIYESDNKHTRKHLRYVNNRYSAYRQQIKKEMMMLILNAEASKLVREKPNDPRVKTFKQLFTLYTGLQENKKINPVDAGDFVLDTKKLKVIKVINISTFNVNVLEYDVYKDCTTSVSGLYCLNAEKVVENTISLSDLKQFVQHGVYRPVSLYKPDDKRTIIMFPGYDCSYSSRISFVNNLYGKQRTYHVS